MKSNILYGGDMVGDIPDISYGEFILKEIWKGGSKRAIIDGDSEESLTYQQIVQKSLQCTHILKQLGLRHGDVISIYSYNRFEFFEPLFAAMCLGVTTAPVNCTYTERELKHCLTITKPKVIFASVYNLEYLVRVMKECDFIETLVLFDRIPVKVQNVVYFEDLLEKTKNECTDIQQYHFPRFNFKETLGLILYSSGTTGLPKGVMLPHYNLVCTYCLYSQPQIIDIEDDDVMVTFLPFFHAYGCISTMTTLARHLLLVVMKRFDLETYLQLIEKYRGTLCMTVPPICVLLAKSPIVDRYDLSSIRRISCGAAPLSKSLEEAVCKRIKVSCVRQGYGMTETTLGVVGTPANVIKQGSVGRLLAGLYGKVVDLETGQPLGPYQEGELCFKGDVIMKGYYGNVTETASTIDSDGWLHTGDIGYYDNEEYFYIVGRLKELIKCNGYQVAPAELEALLLQVNGIKDVGVIGIPHEECGEVPLAFVVKDPAVKLSESEIIQFVADRLSPAKHLKGGVRFISEIPKNASGKILRNKLAELVKENKSKY